MTCTCTTYFCFNLSKVNIKIIVKHNYVFCVNFKIIDQLFNAGVVGPYQGSTAGDVLVETEEELQEILDGLNDL